MPQMEHASCRVGSTAIFSCNRRGELSACHLRDWHRPLIRHGKVGPNPIEAHGKSLMKSPFISPSKFASHMSALQSVLLCFGLASANFGGIA